jgi:hypothetical protein
LSIGSSGNRPQFFRKLPHKRNSPGGRGVNIIACLHFTFDEHRLTSVNVIFPLSLAHTNFILRQNRDYVKSKGRRFKKNICPPVTYNSFNHKDL